MSKLALVALITATAAATSATAAGCNGVVNQVVWGCAAWDNNNGPQFPNWRGGSSPAPAAAVGSSLAARPANGLVAAGAGNLVAAGAGNLVAAGRRQPAEERPGRGGRGQPQASLTAASGGRAPPDARPAAAKGRRPLQETRMIAFALAALLAGTPDAALAPPRILEPQGAIRLERIQYYTRPPPYSYRKYYAYKNNTAPARKPAGRHR